MNEQEFFNRLHVIQYCNDWMLVALAAEACRQYVAGLEHIAKESGVANPRAHELEVMLPHGYQKIVHS